MRYSRRRAKTRNRIVAGSVVVVAIAAGGWWYFGTRPDESGADAITGPVAADASDLQPNAAERGPEASESPAGDYALVSDEQPVGRARASQPDTAEPRDDPETVPDDPTANRAHDDTRSGNRAIEDARKLHAGGKVIEARHELNALLKSDLTAAEDTEVRALLRRIADETIFGKRNLPNDPLVAGYTIQTGDRLIKIAPRYGVPYEILMTMNGIGDPRKVRAGQRLKVPRGPFHAKIYKSRFRLDVYLQDLYVCSYRVGLGTEGGTPEGVWKVKNRLKNPTYFPPASSEQKRIIAADDPSNPLSERWIGLEGIEGNAVGREGYGIHGTIEPESIGKAVSLGCIRMHNEDVEFFYQLMLPGRSTVTILP